MAQFDVYRNPVAGSARDIPYLLDVQSDLLSGLATRVVVPLARPDMVPAKPTDILNPVVTVEGADFLVLTQELAGIPAKRFNRPVVNLADARGPILRALDFVISGF